MRRQKWASSPLLARELAPFDVTVNAVVPGAIRTRAHNRLAPEVIDRIKAGAPAGFIAEPEDVAGCVAFLASDDARYVTGQTLLIDGGRWMVFGANSYVGPMGRTVADTRLLFEAVTGPDRRDPYGQSETPRGAARRRRKAAHRFPSAVRKPARPSGGGGGRRRYAASRDARNGCRADRRSRSDGAALSRDAAVAAVDAPRRHGEA
jgi:hypothetical protein